MVYKLSDFNDLPFTLDEYKNRLAAVRNNMSEKGIDLLLINDPVELNYLLGYRSFGYDALSWQCLLVTLDREPIVITRKLELTSYKQQTNITEYHIYTDNDDPLEVTVDVINKLNIKGKVLAVPFQTKFISPYQLAFLEKNLTDLKMIVDGTTIVAENRLVKSDQEIKYIEEAAKMTSNVMSNLTNQLSSHPTDTEIANVIISNLLDQGSEHPGGMVPIIGVGNRSAFGHPTWENYRAKEKDLIFVEFSGCVNRYFAPMMRTLSIGEPTSLAQKFEEGSRYAVNKVIENTRAGMKVEEITTIYNDALKEKDVMDYSHVRTGYSVGIGFTSWLDGISIKKGEKTVLQKNMVFHIITFLTDFKVGSAISETIIIEDEGARKITDVPQKTLVV